MFVGIFFCGLGNVLVGVVNQYGGFELVLGFDLLFNCLLLFCWGGSYLLDLFFVMLVLGFCCFFFLFVVWGFVLDVDIQSECFRVLGSVCFILGMVLGFVILYIYCGCFFYFFVIVKLVLWREDFIFIYCFFDGCKGLGRYVGVFDGSMFCLVGMFYLFFQFLY